MKRSTSLSKITPLIIAGVAILAILLLAGSLSHLKLLPGDQQLLRQILNWIINRINFRPGIVARPIFGSDFAIIIFRIMFTIMAIGIPLTVIYFFISKEFRKRVLRRMLFWIPILICLILLLQINNSKKPEQEDTEQRPVSSGLQLGDFGSGEEFSETPPQHVPWVTGISTFLLALLTALLLVSAARVAWKKHCRSASSLEKLAGAAQQALDTLQDSENFKNIIIQCYAEMSQVLENQRGIRRREAMTPREFEENLRQLNLPETAVRQLTRTFEAVRYGTKAPSAQEEQQAVASLNLIVEACKNM